MKKFISSILFALIVFSSLELRAQVNQDLNTFIDYIPSPPSSCEEAMNFLNMDSTANELTSAQQIDTLEKFFDKIYAELSLKLEKIKKSLAEKQEERKGNPNGRFRGEMQGPPELQDIMVDMHRSSEILYKIKQAEQKFRNEASERQKSVNREIKKTDLNDNEAKKKIVDSFLKDINELYSKFAAQLKQDFSKLDEISKKYKYDSEEIKPMLRKKILEMQLAEAENLSLLLSCVKGSVEIGSKFYKR